MYDTADDYERFERREIARDRDNRRSASLAIDSRTAERLVRHLRQQNIVALDFDAQLFVHMPTGTTFADQTGLVYFHKGWDAAQDEDE